MKHQLIITADDYAYSPGRSEGIIKCFRDGAITRTSVIVNGNGVAQEIKSALECGIPLGLHYNVTEGSPVCTKQFSTLCDATNKFMFKDMFYPKFANGSVDISEMAVELDCQIERFILLTGRLPFFVDGHQFVHILPDFSELFAQRLQHYGIKETRLPLEDVSSCSWMEESKRLFYSNVYSHAVQCRDVFAKYNLKFTSQFVGLSTFGQNMTVDRLTNQLSRVFGLTNQINSVREDITGNVSCELMTHAGIPCSSSDFTDPDGFSTSVDRQHEMNVLLSDDLRTFFTTSDINLVSSL